MASCWPWEQTQATCRAETPRSSFPQDPPATSDGEELIHTPWGVLCAMSPRAPGRAESRLSTGVTPPSTKLSRLSSLLCLTSSRPQPTSWGHPQINTCPPLSGKAPGLVSGRRMSQLCRQAGEGPSHSAFSVLTRPSADGRRSTHTGRGGGGKSALLSLLIQMLSSSRKSLQIHPESR